MDKRWQRPWRVLIVPYYLDRYARHIHVARVALAFVCGLALNVCFAIPHGSWMLVTILIVLGGVPHWGSVRRKALQRMGGSLLGALAGLAAIWLLPFGAPLFYGWMLLIVALSIWHAQGKGEYLALLTGFTMVIVAGLGDEPMDAALWRSFNVLTGSVIGLAAAAILPLRAMDSWRFLLADNLREAALLYSRISRREISDNDDSLAQFNSRLLRMRGLLSAVAQESGIGSRRLDAIQRSQRSLCSLLDRMWEVAHQTPPLADAAQQRRLIVRTLMRAAHAMRFNQPALLAEALPPACDPLVVLKPSSCHWLVSEFNLAVETLRGQLQALLPALIAVEPPTRELVKRMQRFGRDVGRHARR